MGRPPLIEVDDTWWMNFDIGNVCNAREPFNPPLICGFEVGAEDAKNVLIKHKYTAVLTVDTEDGEPYMLPASRVLQWAHARNPCQEDPYKEVHFKAKKCVVGPTTVSFLFAKPALEDWISFSVLAIGKRYRLKVTFMRSLRQGEFWVPELPIGAVCSQEITVRHPDDPKSDMRIAHEYTWWHQYNLLRVMDECSSLKKPPPYWLTRFYQRGYMIPQGGPFRFDWDRPENRIPERCPPIYPYVLPRSIGAGERLPPNAPPVKIYTNKYSPQCLSHQRSYQQSSPRMELPQQSMSTGSMTQQFPAQQYSPTHFPPTQLPPTQLPQAQFSHQQFSHQELAPQSLLYQQPSSQHFSFQQSSSRLRKRRRSDRDTASLSVSSSSPSHASSSNLHAQQNSPPTLVAFSNWEPNPQLPRLQLPHPTSTGAGFSQASFSSPQVAHQIMPQSISQAPLPLPEPLYPAPSSHMILPSQPAISHSSDNGSSLSMQMQYPTMSMYQQEQQQQQQPDTGVNSLMFSASENVPPTPTEPYPEWKAASIPANAPILYDPPDAHIDLSKFACKELFEDRIIDPLPWAEHER